tara:strand:- start:1501 stop:2082 length:582 start_codon:yes stop_codon:yes gene_type:complete
MDEQTINQNWQDKITNFAKKNIKILIAIMTIFLIGVISFSIFEYFQNEKEKLISEKFINASIFIEKNKMVEGKKILEEVVSIKHKFYSPLALNIIINKKLEKDNEIILEAYDSILSIRSIDKENKNLFKIKKALLLFSMQDEEKIIKTLNPIINSKSIWRSEAIKLIGDYYTSVGEKIKAKEFYKLLNDNEEK